MVTLLTVIITSFALNISCSYSETPLTLDTSLTPLMQAIQNENVEKVKKLLESGADVNAQDDQGRTALFTAAQYGQANIVRELLAAKDIDINQADKDGLTPLQVAVTHGDSDIVNALLDACVRFGGGTCINIDQKDKKLGFTPLARAAASGNEEIIKLLLAHGANPTKVITRENKKKPVFELYPYDDKQVKELFEKKAKEYADRSSALIKALKENKPEEIQKLLALGINVNAKIEDGNTPLHGAAANGKTDIVQFFINEGADVNAKNNRGRTPLLFAALYGHKEIVTFLIQAGANINDHDEDNATPLHFAAASSTGDKDIIGLLLKAGADVEAKDNRYGATPLFFAVMNGNQDIVQALINAGADINIKNKDGLTPLAWATQENNKDMIDLLTKLRAQS